MKTVIPRRSNQGIYKLRKDGASVVFTLTAQMRRTLGWRNGDFVCALVNGETLMVTKIDLRKTVEEGFKCQS